MILRIVDMRYPDPFGHEYMYTNAVYDAAVDRGIPVIIYGSDIPENNPGRNIVPLFHDWKLIQKRSQNLILKLFATIYEWYYVFKKLKSILNHDISQEDVFLFHSPVYRHFPAIYYWYRKLENKPTLILILRYSHNSSKDNLKWFKKSFYLNIFRQWMVKRFYNDFKDDKLILGTDSGILAQEFNKIWQIPVVLFPIPIPNQLYPLPPLSSSASSSKLQPLEEKKCLTIVSLGPARDDKGSYLLYETVIGILDR